VTLADFANVFAILAVQMRFSDADETTIRGYFEALKDLELELVQMAAQRFARTGTWFPKTGEWREMVAQVEGERIQEQQQRVRARLKAGEVPLCSVCSDTGWARNEDTNRVSACECRKLRRLEILGRRPMPALPEASAVK